MNCHFAVLLPRLPRTCTDPAVTITSTAEGGTPACVANVFCSAVRLAVSKEEMSPEALKAMVTTGGADDRKLVTTGIPSAAIPNTSTPSAGLLAPGTLATAARMFASAVATASSEGRVAVSVRRATASPALGARSVAGADRCGGSVGSSHWRHMGGMHCIQWGRSLDQRAN